MKKLSLTCSHDFRRLAFSEFLANEDFNEECAFYESSVFFDRNYKKIWYQKMFHDLLKDLKTELNFKKKLLCFLFFINTCVYKSTYQEIKHIPLNMVGFFFILCELEEFFENCIKSKLSSESNKIFEKRLYLDIKRRIFNIFYYFSTGPQTLNFYLNSLTLFIIKNKRKWVKFRITSEELLLVIKTIEKRKKALIFEFNAQYYYMYNKKAEILRKELSKRPLNYELSDDYVIKLQKKNKYKLPYDIGGPYKQKSKVLQNLLLEAIKKKPHEKKKREKEENMFDNYLDWL